jgi:hypothetical protein
MASQTDALRKARRKAIGSGTSQFRLLEVLIGEWRKHDSLFGIKRRHI